MWWRIAVVLLFFNLITTNEALKIFVGFPLPSKSHSILGHGVVDRLLEAGHEVVHLTSHPREKPAAKLLEINASSLIEFYNDAASAEMFELKNMVGKDALGGDLFFTYMSYVMGYKSIEEPNFIKLLSDPNQKFDAVILEWFFSEVNVGIPALFEAPLIWFASTEAHWQVLRLIDEVPNPAYSVDILATYRAPLDFLQRVEQLWRTVKKYLITNILIYPLEIWFYNSVYPEIAAKRGVTMPSYNDALYNASLMLINAHPSIGGAIKLPQNAVNIAGYHIKDEVKPLPDNLQKLMDGAKYGVIYFSMGSNVKSSGMSENMRKSLLNMFSKFDQTVIWKFESDIKDAPANVHLVKWAPQPSILSHPNLKVFITHGGLLSTTEAIHYGVPLVGIPVMADQHINMGSVENKGFGIKVNLAEDMADELEAAIRRVLKDKSYKERASEISSIYHDRPMKAGAALVYWVEYVVKTRGAPHLRSPGLSVSFYQRFYLDLLALITVTALLVRKIVKFVLKMRSKESSKTKNKKNKKD